MICMKAGCGAERDKCLLVKTLPGTDYTLLCLKHFEEYSKWVWGLLRGSVILSWSLEEFGDRILERLNTPDKEKENQGLTKGNGC